MMIGDCPALTHVFCLECFDETPQNFNCPVRTCQRPLKKRQMRVYLPKKVDEELEFLRITSQKEIEELRRQLAEKEETISSLKMELTQSKFDTNSTTSERDRVPYSVEVYSKQMTFGGSTKSLRPRPFSQNSFGEVPLVHPLVSVSPPESPSLRHGIDVFFQDSEIMTQNDRARLALMFGNLASTTLVYTNYGKNQNSIVEFHKACDQYKRTVVVIKTRDWISGGYADQSWGYPYGYKRSTDAFLFSLTKNRVYKTLNAESAICSDEHSLPMFGCKLKRRLDNQDVSSAADIMIAPNIVKQRCSSHLISFGCKEEIDRDRELFGEAEFKCEGYEVFAVTLQID